MMTNDPANDPERIDPGGIKENLGQIQGNIIGGFNKDYQTLLFLKFNDAAKGRNWVGQMIPEITNSQEVVKFNELFKIVKNRSGREGIVKATWTNIAFTHSGLKALDISALDLNSFPQDFKENLAARAEHVGDLGTSAPENWISRFGTQDIHAVLIVASDSPTDLTELVDQYINSPLFARSATVIFSQEGRTRVEDPGHEHFGFKDGVSQPGIRGVTPPSKDEPHKAEGGEDLLYPGEFVLGYPKQISEPTEQEDGEDINPNRAPGEIATSGPAWTKNGSYLVFRRLRQDVQGFRDMVNELAKTAGIDPDLLGAKFVGRFKSGVPLEQDKDIPVDDPALLDDATINKFEYGEDLEGNKVPRAAHIRKTYPRDQEGGAGAANESQTQTHRLLRRGIPFGNSLGATDRGGANEEFPDDRGLLFLAYQTSIERQFEFVQQAWVNDPNFPCNAAKNGNEDNICKADKPDGQDPIITQNYQGNFQLPTGSGCPVSELKVQSFVTTTGGEYFFQPSIDALYVIAQQQRPTTTCD